jgi:hypothetical protein
MDWSISTSDRPRGRLPLERGGESPEGYRGRPVGEPLWFLWVVGLSILGCDHTGRVFRFVACSFAFYYFSKRGVFPGYQGTLMAVPDSSPRASVVVSVRNPRRLTFADGTFFPPGCCAVPWGRASAPAGVAPEAL